MSCRRCSTCGISYPPTVGQCHVCGGDTGYLSNVDPGDDWETDVALAMQRPSRAEETVRMWRRDQLTRLGFVGLVLDILVEADTDTHVAARLISAGCPVDTAARILI